MISPQDMSPEEWREWYRRTDINRPIKDAMADPCWRLCHLYKIASDTGQEIKFSPTTEQVLVVFCVHVRGWKRILIPKARQLGMSTVICLLKFDLMIFTAGITCALVDKKGEDAADKMRGKIQYAWERLNPGLKAALGTGKCTEGTFELRGQDEKGEDAISTYKAGTQYRGNTCQVLHISEWGWIQANDPPRSKEIMDGSMPAVDRSPNGICIVETTWDGGKAGEVWSLVKEALTTPEEDKGNDTWRILFFAWHSHPGYTRTSGWVDEISGKYFKTIAKEKGIVLTKGQQLWYAEKRRTKGASVMQEYPSFLEECWEKPVPGAIYGEELAELRASGRLQSFEWDRELPLFAAWDIGMADATAVWLIQPNHTELHWLDHMEVEGAPLYVIIDRIMRWEQVYKPILLHFLPHDARRAANPESLKSWQDMASEQGLTNTVIVPRTPDIWQGINKLRPLLRRSRFHVRTDKSWIGADDKPRLSGFGCLESYRKHVENVGSRMKEMPVHDATSHTADAARMFAEAFYEGKVPKMDPDVQKFVRKRRSKARMRVGSSRK